MMEKLMKDLADQGWALIPNMPMPTEPRGHRFAILVHGKVGVNDVVFEGATIAEVREKVDKYAGSLRDMAWRVQDLIDLLEKA